MQLKKVVLPAPLGPITLTIDFGSMVKSRLLTATRPPNFLVTPFASSRAMASGPPAVHLAGGQPRAALRAWPHSTRPMHLPFRRSQQRAARAVRRATESSLPAGSALLR